MVKILSQRFEKSFGLFIMLLVEGSSEVDFLNIFLTTFLGVRKFKNTSAMFKIDSKFQKYQKKKNSENIFRFWDNCTWKCCNKLPLLRREYLASAGNGLANSSKILLGETFSSLIVFTGINTYGKCAFV